VFVIEQAQLGGWRLKNCKLQKMQNAKCKLQNEKWKKREDLTGVRKVTQSGSQFFLFNFHFAICILHFRLLPIPPILSICRHGTFKICNSSDSPKLLHSPHHELPDALHSVGAAEGPRICARRHDGGVAARSGGG
jgi:hypothetical protein